MIPVPKHGSPGRFALPIAMGRQANARGSLGGVADLKTLAGKSVLRPSRSTYSPIRANRGTRCPPISTVSVNIARGRTHSPRSPDSAS